ncbi:MAG: hypothetical protein ACI81P_003611 [Neolewinella sp.]|jgi:hypothetical protein
MRVTFSSLLLFLLFTACGDTTNTSSATADTPAETPVMENKKEVVMTPIFHAAVVLETAIRTAPSWTLRNLPVSLRKGTKRSKWSWKIGINDPSFYTSDERSTPATAFEKEAPDEKTILRDAV